MKKIVFALVVMGIVALGFSVPASAAYDHTGFRNAATSTHTIGYSCSERQVHEYLAQPGGTGTKKHCATGNFLVINIPFYSLVTCTNQAHTRKISWVNATQGNLDFVAYSFVDKAGKNSGPWVCNASNYPPSRHTVHTTASKTLPDYTAFRLLSYGPITPTTLQYRCKGGGTVFTETTSLGSTLKNCPKGNALRINIPDVRFYIVGCSNDNWYVEYATTGWQAFDRYKLDSTLGKWDCRIYSAASAGRVGSKGLTRI